jgi:flagellar basal-body rod protein FlgC
MAAQSVRLNTTASNLANAESVSGDPARSTRRAIRSSKPCARSSRHRGHAAAPTPPCRCAASTNRTAPAAQRYEPGNPLADANGYVYAPAVNVVEEMVNMISASRSYQNNVEVMNTSKDLLLATLRLGQG